MLIDEPTTSAGTVTGLALGCREWRRRAPAWAAAARTGTRQKSLTTHLGLLLRACPLLYLLTLLSQNNDNAQNNEVHKYSRLHMSKSGPRRTSKPRPRAHARPHTTRHGAPVRAKRPVDLGMTL